MLASRGMAAATIALVALGQLALFLPNVPAPVRGALNAPLALFLPGLAWMSLLRTPGLDVATRLVLSVACTLMLIMFTGLALNVAAEGLSTRAWIVTLGLLTVIPALVRLLTGAAPMGHFRIPARSLLLTLPWAVALAGLALTHDLALHSAAERRDAGFTQLWLVADPGSTCAGQLHVGMASFELETVSFHLTVLADRELIAEQDWPNVAPTQRVEAILTTDRPTASVVEVRLSRSDQPNEPYRWTRLDCSGSAAGAEVPGL
jgi:hypothetical protein